MSGIYPEIFVPGICQVPFVRNTPENFYARDLSRLFVRNISGNFMPGIYPVLFAPEYTWNVSGIFFRTGICPVLFVRNMSANYCIRDLSGLFVRNIFAICPEFFNIRNSSRFYIRKFRTMKNSGHQFLS